MRGCIEGMCDDLSGGGSSHNRRGCGHDTLYHPVTFRDKRQGVLRQKRGGMLSVKQEVLRIERGGGGG